MKIALLIAGVYGLLLLIAIVFDLCHHTVQAFRRWTNWRQPFHEFWRWVQTFGA